MGQNASRHYVATLGDGRRFGLKASIGGVGHEELAGHLARLVHAPNSTRYAVDPAKVLAKPRGLSTIPIVKVEWLSGDTGNLGDPSIRADILTSAGRFYHQFGEWMATGLFLGVSDRDNPGNWVWDKRQRRLQMIDFEYAFKARTPEDYTRFLTKAPNALADGVRWRSCPNYYPPGLMHGFLSMRHRIRSHFPLVSEYLIAKGQADHVAELRDQIRVPDLGAFSAVTKTVVGA